MLLDTEVEIRLGNRVKYYEDLGYEIPRRKNNYKFTIAKDATIKVKVQDLPLGSKIKVNVLCDYCEKVITPKSYGVYLKEKEKTGKDCCRGCFPCKSKETNLERYGVERASQQKSSKQSLSLAKRTDETTIIKNFALRGYMVENIEFNYGKTTYIYYHCLLHMDDGLQKISLYKFNIGHGCKHCGKEISRNNSKGSKSNFWKGGITNISSFLREKILVWKKESFKFYDYTCCVTGEKSNLVIHHVYNFNKIVKENI